MASHKCIIIDDEPRICQLINKLGDWSALDIEVAAVCYDGEGAVEKILEIKPDIVLSDIQVPIYNGLEIIEQVQKANLHPLFIIISGYSQFEYAQKAIQLKAVDYLLKPINKDKLNTALLKCCDMLTTENKHATTSQALAAAQEDLFWNDLYRRKYQISSPKEFKEHYGVTWFEETYYMAAFSISNKTLMEQQSLYMEKVLDIFSHIFESGSFFCDYSCGCIYLLFHISHSQKISSLLQTLFTHMKRLENTFGRFSLTIGYSIPFFSTKDIPAALQQAHEAMNYRFAKIPGAIYSYSTLPPRISCFHDFIDETFTNNLIYYARQLDQTALKDFLNKFQQNFQDSAKHDFSNLADYGTYILNIVMTTTQYSEHKIVLQRFLFDTNFCNTCDAFFDLLQKNINHIIATQQENSTGELSASVSAAKQYIDTHYSEKIYLDDLAKSVFLNSTYLSSVFKKELGMSTTDYINLVRCKRARDLLKDSCLSLSAIAEKTGYADEKYFQHQFKKIIGITPTQFRRLYS